MLIRNNKKKLSLSIITIFIFCVSAFSQDQFLELKWKNVGFNYTPGKADLLCEDIDKDGQQEILLDFNYGQYFAIIKFINNDYQFSWISPLYADDKITSIKIYDLDNDSNSEICVLHLSGKIDVFNSRTMLKDTTYNTGINNSATLNIGDIDNDGITEFIIGQLSWGNASLYILNSKTLAQEWSLSNILIDKWDIEIGDVDNDSVDEIVLSNGMVIDGVTRQANWNYVQGFGTKIALGDIDGDNVKEIISLSDYYDINAFDAINKTPLWSIISGEDLNTLYVTDTDKDGYDEIIVGNNQWGSISCYSPITKSKIWAINNPTHGSTNIAFGDPDNDGNDEVIWSAGESTSGPDYLHIGDVEKKILEWQSLNLDGPFYVDIYDLNGDGYKEICVASTTSDNNYGSGQILVYNSTSHKMEWNSGDPNPHSWYFSTVKVGNIDTSEQVEIIAASGSNLYIFDSESHNFKSASISTNNNYYKIRTMEIADIDNDGDVEIIIGDDQGYLHIINGNTLQKEWQSVKVDGSIKKIIITDFDADEAKEIVVLNYLGYITVYDGITHFIEWKSNFINNVTTFDFGDINGNGTKKFIIGTQNGQILIVDSLTKGITDTLVNIGETIAGLEIENIDMDPSAEIIVGATRLYVFNASDMSKKYESELLGSSTGFGNNLIITDAENDNHMDIFVTNNSGIYHFRCTETFPDIIPPTVISSYPKKNASKVSTNTSIRLVFSEELNEATITRDNVKILANDSLEIPLSFYYTSGTRTLEIIGDTLIPGNASIQVFCSANITDKALNGLDGNNNSLAEGSPTDDYYLNFSTGTFKDTIGPSFINININRTELWSGFEIQIKATVSDSSDVTVSPIEYAECFIDTVRENKTGEPFQPIDGLFNSAEEEVTITIQTNNWTAGEHNLHLVAKDIEGNIGKITIPINILSQDKMSANWSMFGQNPQHTDFNANDSINLPLNLKWTKKIFNNPLNQVAVADNMIFATENNNQSSSKVVSLNTETGDTTWTYEIWGNSYVKAPAYYKGRLYVPIIYTPSYGSIYVFDAVTGEFLWDLSFGFEIGPYITISDDRLFIAYKHGNFYAFSILERKFLWKSTVYSTRYDWVPAYADGILYTSGQNSSYCAYTADSGKVISSFGSPMVGETPVILDNIILSTNPVTAININDGKILWSKPGNIKPAAAYNKIFMVSADSLLVLDQNTGTLLWGFKTNSNIIRPPIISNNHVFISSTKSIYAININTQSEVWSYPVSGNLVVANNQLFLSPNDGFIYCFQSYPVSVKNENIDLPTVYNLTQNYPNPFNPETTIEYSLPKTSLVKIEIYNQLGELIQVLINSEKPAGHHRINWKAESISSGVYFYRIIADSYVNTKKMIILK